MGSSLPLLFPSRSFARSQLSLHRFLASHFRFRCFGVFFFFFLKLLLCSIFSLFSDDCESCEIGTCFISLPFCVKLFVPLSCLFLLDRLPFPPRKFRCRSG